VTHAREEKDGRVELTGRGGGLSSFGGIGTGGMLACVRSHVEGGMRREDSRLNNVNGPDIQRNVRLGGRNFRRRISSSVGGLWADQHGLLGDWGPVSAMAAQLKVSDIVQLSFLLEERQKMRGLWAAGGRGCWCGNYGPRPRARMQVKAHIVPHRFFTHCTEYSVLSRYSWLVACWRHSLAPQSNRPAASLLCHPSKF